MTIAIAFFASRSQDPGWGAKINDNTRLSRSELPKSERRDEAGFAVRTVCWFAALRVEQKIGLRQIDNDTIRIGKDKGGGLHGCG